MPTVIHPKEQSPPEEKEIDPVEKELKNQQAEWIKYAQTTERNMGDKYDETAKTFVGLFAGIFGVFTLLLSFFGLPGQVNVNIGIAMGTILCFALSIICMLIVIGPRRFIPSSEGMNYADWLGIWQNVADRNKRDHLFLMIGIGLFVLGIVLIPCSIAASIINPGDTVQIVASSDKIPYLNNASITFRNNSTLSDEMHLVRQDAKTYTFRLVNGNKVTVTSDWVQAIVTKP